MSRTEDFKLVGHLQVLDEPLASLYIDTVNGGLFCFVRIYQDGSEDNMFVLSFVSAAEMLDYLDGRVGLAGVFGEHPNYFYNASKNRPLSARFFEPRDHASSMALLTQGGLQDKFDKQLGYRGATLRRFLRSRLEQELFKGAREYEQASVYSKAG